MGKLTKILDKTRSQGATGSFRALSGAGWREAKGKRSRREDKKKMEIKGGCERRECGGKEIKWKTERKLDGKIDRQIDRKPERKNRWKLEGEKYKQK